ncbi:hypothetical protein [uncultured Tenacibaculum sp.]|uniref:hypothetical protein n=1 Tax=uncultured Tenacibaculum sp. TaxID=174713 RepID=UPI002626FE53|nr:hypothetical protein [uncultured Tenacibaculum sp.]
MQITQVENGNIIVLNDKKQIVLVSSKVVLNQHPRIKEGVLISDQITKNEEQGVSVLSTNLLLNGKNISGDIQSVFRKLSLELSLNGILDKKVVSVDPYKKVWEDAKTYEKLLLFVKGNDQDGATEIKDGNGKVTRVEYYCQFDTFFIRVHLNYYYLTSDPSKISHILMSGNTEHVLLPLKRYNYTTNGVSYTYESLT